MFMRKLKITIIAAASLFLLALPTYAETGSEQQSVNINLADLEELDKHLDGVGKAKAKLILDYREEHGDFSKIDDLMKIKGLGKVFVEKNKDRIVF